MMPRGVLPQMAWGICDCGNQVELCYAFKRPVQLGCGSLDKDLRFLGVSINFQFSSVKSLSHVWLFENPMDCNMPSFLVYQQLSEFTQTHILELVMPSTISSSVVPFSHLQSFSASGSFPMSQFFTSGGQSIVSASASVLPSAYIAITNAVDWVA